jgi:putative DNA primase/helicase
MTPEIVLSRFEGVRKLKDGFLAKCPAHDDRKPSLSITIVDGKILFHCHAGCPTENILSTLGLTMADLFTHSGNGARKVKPERSPVVATYDYVDEQGGVLFRVCRTATKVFFQQRFEGGKFINGLEGTRKVIYNLPEVLKAPWVAFVEGEKDVESLEKIGIVATTSPGGAGKWDDSYAQYLKDKRVAIIPDTTSRAPITPIKSPGRF